METSSINTEQIQTLRTDMNENLANPDLLAEKAKVAAEVVAALEKVTGVEMVNRFTDTDYLRKHVAFIEAATSLRNEINPQSDLDRMILSSDILTLHFLLVNDGVDLIVDNKVKRGDVLPNESREELEARSIVEYLDKCRKFNSTSKYAQLSTVPIGLEYEFKDIAEHVIYNSPKLSSEQHDELRKLIIESDMRDNKFYPSKSLSELGNFRQHKEIVLDATHELVVKPTYSLDESLRNLIHLRQAGTLEGSITIHETFADVLLTKEHTEIMDTRLVLAAAGILYPKKRLDVEKTLQNFRTDGILVWEAYSKTSPEDSDEERYYYEDGNAVYFPYFRRRFTSKLHSIDDKEYENAVECRSYPAFTVDKDFARIVRIRTYTWLSANAIKAVQKPEEERTEEDTLLSNIWHSHMQEWETILKNHGINPLEDKDYFIPSDTFSTMNSEEIKEFYKKNRYTQKINEILVKMLEDERFREESFACLTRFNSNVKGVFENSDKIYQ